MGDEIILQETALEAAVLSARLGNDEHGALVSFAGIVRRSEGELRLRSIDYQAYDGMAQSAIAQILAEAHAKWPPFRAVVAHRVGEVPVGEASVWIGVSCGHRAEAFELARYLIDELKQRVPIWKREHLPEEDRGTLDSPPPVE